VKALPGGAEGRRTKLLVASGICLAIYGFVSLIASAFAYGQIAVEPWFYLPAIWLNAYLLFALCSGIKALPGRGWQATGLVVHVVSIPSMFLSYFLLGTIIFPIVTWHWVSFYRACYPEHRSWLPRELL
jgi:hypothetical protein